jgi:hypothetical protein
MRLIKEFHFYDELLSIQEALSNKSAKDWRRKIRELCDQEGGDYEQACRVLNIPLSGPAEIPQSIADELTACCIYSSSDWSYENGEINTKGNFRISPNLLKDGVLVPEIRFGTADGDFEMDSHSSLVSLERFPRRVEGQFKISYSKNLINLIGCPDYIGGRFLGEYLNTLTSLEGCPSFVGGDFHFPNCNNLVSLAGAENCDVKGGINIGHCNLQTLEGGFANYNPTNNYSFFSCGYNNLINLIGAPSSNSGYKIDCDSNPNLYSLQGAPLSGNVRVNSAGKCLLPDKTLKEVYRNAIKFQSWVAAYFYLITTPQFQRMSKAQRDPIRAEISPEKLKSKAFALSSIWRDPIMQDRAVLRLLKRIQLSDEQKKAVDDLSDLSDLGFL